MKQLLFICFFTFYYFLYCQVQQPFSIFIQDSVVIMKKSQDVVPVNITITKYVEEDFPLQNFFQFIKKDHFYTYYEVLDGTIVFSNEKGLSYYIEDEQGELITWIGCTEVLPIKIITHSKKRKEECVNIRRKKIVHKNKCENQQISSLTSANTCFTIYPMIKRDFLYREESKKGKDIYLVVYYVIPPEKGKPNNPIIIHSNKIKLIVK